MQLTTFTANLEHVELVTPISRLNIVVESIDIEKGYNAFVNDKILRQRIVDVSKRHDTMAKALEDLLELTCMMVDFHRTNPSKWRRQFARLVKTLLHQSPFPNTIVGEEDTEEVSPVLPRGQKRNASVMETTEDDEHFAGFTRLPARVHPAPNRRETLRRDIASGFSLSPARDARSAAASCASLPSIISDGARRMLYELLTRPQFPPPSAGVSLSQITRDTGLQNLDMVGYLHDLERVGKARQTGPATWLPVDSPVDSMSSPDPHDSQRASPRPGPSGPERSLFPAFQYSPRLSGESQIPNISPNASFLLVTQH